MTSALAQRRRSKRTLLFLASLLFTFQFWVTRSNGASLSADDLDYGSLEVNPTLTLANGQIVDLNPILANYEGQRRSRHVWRTTLGLSDLLEESKVEQNVSSIHSVAIAASFSKVKFGGERSKSKAVTLSLPVVHRERGQETVFLTSSSRNVKVSFTKKENCRSLFLKSDIGFF